MLSKNPSLENIPIEEHLNSPVNEKLPSSSKTQIQPVCEEREIKLFEKK